MGIVLNCILIDSVVCDLENVFGALQEFGGHLFRVFDPRILKTWRWIGGVPHGTLDIE